MQTPAKKTYLHDLITKSGKTQRELATLLGISAKHLNQLVLGKRRLTTLKAEQFLQLATMLQVNPHALAAEDARTARTRDA